MVNRFVADPRMYAKPDQFEANRQRLQNMKNERVGGKEIRKLESQAMLAWKANREKLQNQKFERVGGKEIRKLDEAKGLFDSAGLETVFTDFDEPNAYRYYNHPRPGSIYRLKDIPQLVRGPTLVMLPSGKEIQVPRMARREIQAKADAHAAVQGTGKLQELLKLLGGKQGPSAPAGFKTGRAPAFQIARDHPRQNLQHARMGGGVINF